MQINENNDYGYVIMEHAFPYDEEVFETETYEEAKTTLDLILKQSPERRVYIREITREEVKRAANIKAHAI